MSKYFSLILLGAIVLTSCTNDPVADKELAILNIELASILNQKGGEQGLSSFVMPESDELWKIPQDPLNPLTAEKVFLGKFLYHETGLGVVPRKEVGLHTYSCASCHHAKAGFQANMQQGIGEGGTGFGLSGEARTLSNLYQPEEIDVQPLRTPSALNVAFQTNMLWNGQFGATGVNKGTETRWLEGTPIATNHLGYEGVEIQAIAGLGVHRMDCDSTLVNTSSYKAWFDNAFANIPEQNRYTKETAGLAIAAFERTLLATESPFQQWLKGDKESMSNDELKGAILFFGKGNCGSCHKGPALNDMSFYALGMEDMNGGGTYNASSDNSANLGRGSFTGNAADDFKFKVPQLYNLKDSPFYGHGGTFNSIREVVEYKNIAQKENANVPSSQLASGFAPLGLTEQEIGFIIAFLENGLYDPNLARFEPVELPSGMCFPNADVQSKIDMSCE
ncbi:MAG: cytochrome c peroxidase [Bacteroidota bacterium]